MLITVWFALFSIYGDAVTQLGPFKDRQQCEAAVSRVETHPRRVGICYEGAWR